VTRMQATCCQSASDHEPAYCLICERYPDDAIAADDPMSAGRVAIFPRSAEFDGRHCSKREILAALPHHGKVLLDPRWQIDAQRQRRRADVALAIR
jgi:hypothetical protein